MGNCTRQAALAQRGSRCRPSMLRGPNERSAPFPTRISCPRMSDHEEPQQPEIPESELIRVRREKLERIVALGFDAYPTKADFDTTIAEVVKTYGEKKTEELEAAHVHVKIAGRIMAI